MKKEKIIFWIATGAIFLFEGVMPALTSQTELAREGIRHLGYPAYFGTLLTVFKVAGALVLVIPQFPMRVKEWAYAGFGIVLISAAVSNWAVDGFSGLIMSSVVGFGILLTSYVYYHRIYSQQ